MSTPKPLPPLEVLSSAFEVRDGRLYWAQPGHGITVGAEATNGIVNRGYRRVFFQRKWYSAHRIIWAIANQQDPGVSQVDHIDRNKLNNDPSNLRLATPRLNQLNTGLSKANTSGVKGVCFNAKKNRWIAHAKRHGRSLHLGYFDTKELAAAARQAWEESQWEKA